MYKIIICSDSISEEEDLACVGKVLKIEDKLSLKDKIVSKGSLPCNLLFTVPVISGAIMLIIGESYELFAVAKGFNDRKGNPCCWDFYISDDLSKIEKCIPLQKAIQPYLERFTISSKPYPTHMTAYSIIGTFLNEFVNISGCEVFVANMLDFIFEVGD